MRKRGSFEGERNYNQKRDISKLPPLEGARGRTEEEKNIQHTIN